MSWGSCSSVGPISGVLAWEDPWIMTVDRREDERRVETKDELLRVREGMHKVADALQQLSIKHDEIKGSIDKIEVQSAYTSATLSTVQTDTKVATGALQTSVDAIKEKIPDLLRRITMLERIVYGAVGIILVAVLTAWLSGAIIVPGRDIIQQVLPQTTPPAPPAPTPPSTGAP